MMKTNITMSFSDFLLADFHKRYHYEMAAL